MIDVEKVLRGWERCKACDMRPIAPEEGQKAYLDCEYTIGMYCGKDKLIYETMEILKHLEPVYPKYEPSIRGIDIKCGYCGNRMYTIRDTVSADYPKHHIRFCSECGKGVKWDG